MNVFTIVKILLVTILALQAAGVNGAKGVSELKRGVEKKSTGISKSTYAIPDIHVRSIRAAKSSNQDSEAVGNKRTKNSKKVNKNAHLEGHNAAAGATAIPSDTNNQERAQSSSLQDEKQSSVPSSTHQHLGNGNNKLKQKQMLRSQIHQTHVKRGGGNAKMGTDKKSDEQKQSGCRYSKSSWSECDAKTNSRSRTLTLKKGESSCTQTKTIQKKCKKSCRYEKGSWSECTSGQMTRQDKLKVSGETTCEPTRAISKKCNPGGKPKDKSNKERKNKDKAPRKAAAA